MKEAVFKLKDFTFRYPESNAGISMPGVITIYKEDIVLLSGVSGAGKSTLLYALKGLVPETIFGKTGGSLFYRDKDLFQIQASERSQIGFLFQNPDAQMINTTVRNEIAFGMENLSIAKEDIVKKIEFLAKEFDIGDLLDRNIPELSGGEKQKVALLSILAMEPEVILFDEPTAFLDPDSAKHFIDVFYKISGAKTIIIVEHNIQYLKGHITRYLFIDKDGVIREKNINDIDRLNTIPPGHSSILQDKILLKTESLSFSYDERIILNNINFEIKCGEIVGIKGKNGAGKSTFLKILSGVMRSYNGSIFYKDTDIQKLGWKKYFKESALLFQNPEVHFIFDKAIKEVENKKEILDDINLSGFGDRNPFTLSEGQKRRLSIGTLLAIDKNIFFLDEPTFGQDRANKQNLIEMILKMRDAGKVFVIVSHDLEFLDALCDRTITLDNGSLK